MFTNFIHKTKTLTYDVKFTERRIFVPYDTV